MLSLDSSHYSIASCMESRVFEVLKNVSCSQLRGNWIGSAFSLVYAIYHHDMWFLMWILIASHLEGEIASKNNLSLFILFIYNHAFVSFKKYSKLTRCYKTFPVFFPPYHWGFCFLNLNPTNKILKTIQWLFIEKPHYFLFYAMHYGYKDEIHISLP